MSTPQFYATGDWQGFTKWLEANRMEQKLCRSDYEVVRYYNPLFGTTSIIYRNKAGKLSYTGSARPDYLQFQRDLKENSDGNSA